MSEPTQTKLHNAATLMARRRDEKLGKRGLYLMGRRAARTKAEIYGPDWAVRAGKGEKLIPLPVKESE